MRSDTDEKPAAGRFFSPRTPHNRRLHITLELGEASHDGAHQLAARRAEVEAQAGLRKNAHPPAMEVIKCLHEVLGASSPARKLGHQDGADLSALRKRHRLLALRTIVLRPRCRLLVNGYYPVSSAFGERPDPVLGARTIGHRC